MSRPLKIELPAELRADILAWQKRKPEEIVAWDQAVAKAEKQLAEFHQARAGLGREVVTLKAATRFDDDAGLEKIVKSEARLQLLDRQIREAAEAVDDLKASPVTLNLTGLMSEIRELYVQSVPHIVGEALTPFYFDQDRAVRAALNTDAFTSLQQFYSFIKWHAHRRATPDQMEFANTILNRALAGNVCVYSEAAAVTS